MVKHYVNLGIAAATPRGLLVPNIKDAQEMTMVELAAALEQLTLTAREGKTQPAEMQGGTITITNIGVFGMDTGTPILNPGEVAIVALGTIKQKPWVVDGEVRPRFVTTIGPRSTTASSTAMWPRASSPTSRRSSRSPRSCSSSRTRAAGPSATGGSRR